MTVFFVWVGSDNLDIHTIGLGSYGPLWQYRTYNGQVFGAIQVSSASARTGLDALHDDIVVLPGVNGKLNGDQVTAILPSFPTAVVHMAMYDVLAAIYTAIPDAEFLNPDAY